MNSFVYIYCCWFLFSFFFEFFDHFELRKCHILFWSVAVNSRIVVEISHAGSIDQLYIYLTLGCLQKCWFSKQHRRTNKTLRIAWLYGLNVVYIVYFCWCRFKSFLRERGSNIKPDFVTILRWLVWLLFIYIKCNYLAWVVIGDSVSIVYHFTHLLLVLLF